MFAYRFPSPRFSEQMKSITNIRSHLLWKIGSRRRKLPSVNSSPRVYQSFSDLNESKFIISLKCVWENLEIVFPSNSQLHKTNVPIKIMQTRKFSPDSRRRWMFLLHWQNNKNEIEAIWHTTSETSLQELLLNYSHHLSQIKQQQ